jgi:hypothetical protein
MGPFEAVGSVGTPLALAAFVVAAVAWVYRARLAEQAAKTPALGKTLKVVRGRKVPIGTVGECCWIGPAFRKGLRVGIRTLSGDKVYTNADNVEVVL